MYLVFETCVTSWYGCLRWCCDRAHWAQWKTVCNRQHGWGTYVVDKSALFALQVNLRTKLLIHGGKRPYLPIAVWIFLLLVHKGILKNSGGVIGNCIEKLYRVLSKIKNWYCTSININFRYILTQNGECWYSVSQKWLFTESRLNRVFQDLCYWPLSILLKLSSC